MTDEICIKITNTKTRLIEKYKVHRLQVEKAMRELPVEELGVSSRWYRGTYVIGPDGKHYGVKKFFLKFLGIFTFIQILQQDG